MLVEFASGKMLFPGNDEKEQFALHMELLGVPDQSFLSQCRHASMFFCRDGTPVHDVYIDDKKVTPKSISLVELVGETTDPQLLDFISRCICMDPTSRMSASEALQHPFITGIIALPLSTSKKNSPVRIARLIQSASRTTLV